MLQDSRQRSIKDLVPQVLTILARSQDEKLDSKIVAQELKTETEEINSCFEEMKYLRLIELFTCFGPRYLARITPLGLANIETKNNSVEKKNE